MAALPLIALIGEETRVAPPPRVAAAVDAIRSRHGPAIVAILFYGSALRAPGDRARMLDFYVLTVGNRAFHRRLLPAVLNRVLPPTVYHMSLPIARDESPARAKYAVISLRSFERRTGRGGLEPLGWGRFSQPCAIVHARDDEIRGRVVRALAGAAETMLRETIELMPRRFSSADIWIRALRESYGAELRAERPGRAAELYALARERYDRIAQTVFASPPVWAGTVRVIAPGEFEHELRVRARMAALSRWRMRRIAGKTLSAMRLVKSVFTFDGGLDYILEKIEDHSGVALVPTPWQRRHPLLAAPLLAWRLYRRGAFR